MPETAVGHGTAGTYECLPASKHYLRTNQLDGLRCGSMLREPGGLKEPVVHVWTLRGRELVPPIAPDRQDCDGGDAIVFLSYFPVDQLPADPTGSWACETHTLRGQLVGRRKFEVVRADSQSAPATPSPQLSD